MSWWLCQADLTEGILKTKRRKLHGASNKKVVAILEKVCTRRLYLDIKATCFSLGDYICHKCITMIENGDLFMKKAVLKANELVEKLEVSIGEEEKE